MSGGARKSFAWAVCVAAIAFFAWRVVIPAARDPYTNGFATCYVESRILLENPRDLRHIYEDDWFQGRVDHFLGRHVAEIAQGQPPTMSLILAPFALLSPAAARTAWVIVSTLLWVAGLAALADGLALGSFCGVPPVVWLAAATTPFPPIAENLARGQAYALLFFLLGLVVRFVLQARRLGGGAGIPLGLMLVFKSAGLWLWPLLAAAGQWRPLAVAAATGMAVVFLCSPLMGWHIWPIYLSQALRWLSSEPSNHLPAYQTLHSLTGHLFIRDPIWNPTPVAHLPWLAVLLGSLVLGTLFTVSIRLQDIGSGLLRRRALTMGMFIAPMVPVAPIGEGYHYVLAFPAVLVGWWWAFRAPAATMKRKALVVACTVLICAPQRYYSSRHLQEGWAALLAYPRVYGALALWGTLAYALKESEGADRRSCRVR